MNVKELLHNIADAVQEYPELKNGKVFDQYLDEGEDIRLLKVFDDPNNVFDSVVGLTVSDENKGKEYKCLGCELTSTKEEIENNGGCCPHCGGTDD